LKIEYFKKRLVTVGLEKKHTTTFVSNPERMLKRRNEMAASLRTHNVYRFGRQKYMNRTVLQNLFLEYTDFVPDRPLLLPAAA